VTVPAVSAAQDPALRPMGAGLPPAFGHLREIVLFLAIGGTSAAIYVVLGVFFTSLCGFRPSLAIAASLVLLMPPTYLVQRSLTFRSDRKHASAFPRYVATQILGNALAVIGSELFPAAIRGRPWLAFSAVAIGVAATNYALLKLWTFRRSR
jgi:putative flippase GtrA